MLENAVRICDAKLGNLWLREGDKFRIVAIHGASQEYRDYLYQRTAHLTRPAKRHGSRSPLLGKSCRSMTSALSRPTARRMRIATIEIAKARTLVAVPMLKDNEVIGIIAIYRQEVRAFTDKQIELVQNFAAQAVIAIENTRLLNELREPSRWSSRRQRPKCLSVISSSPGELEPVFQAMLENATRICEAKFGVLQL